MRTRLLLLLGFFVTLNHAEQQKCYIELNNNIDYEAVLIPRVLHEYKELLEYVNSTAQCECLQELCSAIAHGQPCTIYKHLAGGMQTINTALATTGAQELCAFKEEFAAAQQLVEHKDSSIFAKPDALTRGGNINPSTVTTNSLQTAPFSAIRNA